MLVAILRATDVEPDRLGASLAVFTFGAILAGTYVRRGDWVGLVVVIAGALVALGLALLPFLPTEFASLVALSALAAAILGIGLHHVMAPHREAGK
ncbi:MAG: hypothetical protein AABY18_02285 [Candidatus Thermoplasmatota archaeon]